jgi:hypothetical protein
LVDLARERVEAHTAPDPAAGYKQVQIFSIGDDVPLPGGSPATVPARSVLKPGD